MDESEVRFIRGRAHGGSASEVTFPRFERVRLSNGKPDSEAWLTLEIRLVHARDQCRKGLTNKWCTVLRVRVSSRLSELRNEALFYTLGEALRHVPVTCHPRSSL